MSKIKVALILGLILGFSNQAFANCTLVFGISSVAISWDLNFSYQAISFTVTNNSGLACDYGIGFSRGGASNYTRRMVGPTGVTLNYQLYKDSNLSNLLRDAPDITSGNDVILGHFDAGVATPQTLTYYVQVPLALATAPAFKPYGSYTDTYMVNAYEGANPVLFASPITTASVNVSVVIPRIVQLSVGSTGDSFDPTHAANSVPFGSLITGMVAQRDLLVRTNAGYSITLSSANHGAMANNDPMVATTVPYSLTVNGASVNLSSSQNPITISGQTSLAGDRYPVLIRIGNIKSSMAGSYTDTISVSVVSTD